MLGIAFIEKSQTRPFKREISHTSHTSISQVVPGKIHLEGPIHLPVLHNNTDRAVYILKQKGYSGKVFCKTEIPIPKSGLKVHSDKCNWILKLGTFQDIEVTPEKYYNALKDLIKNGVPVKRIAYAKPEPREEPFGIINEELRRGIGTFAKGVGYFILFLLHTLKNIIRGKKEASTNETSSYHVDAPAPELLVAPDPILLVQVQNSWIEIGRWI